MAQKAARVPARRAWAALAAASAPALAAAQVPGEAVDLLAKHLIIQSIENLSQCSLRIGIQRLRLAWCTIEYVEPGFSGTAPIIGKVIALTSVRRCVSKLIIKRELVRQRVAYLFHQFRRPVRKQWQQRINVVHNGRGRVTRIRLTGHSLE